MLVACSLSVLVVYSLSVLVVLLVLASFFHFALLSSQAEVSSAPSVLALNHPVNAASVPAFLVLLGSELGSVSMDPPHHLRPILSL